LQEAEPAEKGDSAMIEIEDFAVTSVNLRLDSRVTDPLPHDIWGPEVAFASTRFPQIVETTIEGTTLHVDLRLEIPKGLVMEAVLAWYRRLAPDTGRTGFVGWLQGDSLSPPCVGSVLRRRAGSQVGDGEVQVAVVLLTAAPSSDILRRCPTAVNWGKYVF